ncbi:hypothetical protein JC2156_04250 [Weissella koreensis KCTC 3621]|uniref:hypothetical protein n=1 Tax=Weissella koreensis TaxID=165096 RepID=UPI00026F3646|nr:hypothetical protein [Weissella koreensis]EJF33715.1 hypothetical protein JC2156_05290 [Weissella koreensis KCTC 3621]EJF34117.1 hypothetical protein JC2156_04250 [Weissella koreensis KCTC 3621]
MAISLFITRKDGSVHEMPMVPETISYSKESGNSQIDVIQLGEITRLGNTKLSRIDLDIRLPVDLRANKSYITASRLEWDSGNKYQDMLHDIFENHEVARFVITDTFFNDVFTIESYEPTLNEQAGMYTVSLKLVQWVDYAPLILTQAPVPKSQHARPTQVQNPRSSGGNIGVGSVVIVNGQLHRDSYGSGPGLTEANATRKVNFTAPGRAYPYHVTMMDGGWRGWVSAESVRLA